MPGPSGKQDAVVEKHVWKTPWGGDGMLLEPSIHKALAPHPRLPPLTEGAACWAQGCRIPFQVNRGEQLPHCTAGSCWPSVLPVVLTVLLTAERTLWTLTQVHSPSQHLRGGCQVLTTEWGSSRLSSGSHRVRAHSFWARFQIWSNSIKVGDFDNKEANLMFF